MFVFQLSRSLEKELGLQQHFDPQLSQQSLYAIQTYIFVMSLFIFLFINRDELKWFLKLNAIQGAFMSFFFSSSVVISFVTFATYVLTGEILKAQTVFTCISLFNMIRVVMALHFPIALSLVNECRVSIKRMQVSTSHLL